MKELSCLLIFCSFISIFHVNAQRNSSKPLPDFFGIMSEETNMVKIDLLNAVRDLDKDGFSGFLSVGFEQKIVPALSIDATVSTWYLLRFSPASSSKIFTLPDGSISLVVSPRFYYAMNKRIREGWGNNNFSGNYFSLQGTTQLIFFRRDSQILGGKGVYFFQGFTVAPIYGMQRRIGRRGFIDFNFGLRFLNGSNVERGFIIRTPDERRWLPSPISSMRIGVAF